MKFEGILEVFKNKKGYNTAVLKAWDDETKEITGKVYLDVNLPKDLPIEDGQTLTLDVHEGYVNCVHVDSKDGGFNKIKLSVVRCELKSVFPEKKVKKSSKRSSSKEELPF